MKYLVTIKTTTSVDTVVPEYFPTVRPPLLQVSYIMTLCVSSITDTDMGKGQQKPAQQSGPSQVKTPKKLSYPTVIHPDLYQRSNFTLQASAFLQQLNLELSSSDVKGKRKWREGDMDIRTKGSDSDRLARNMMAANGKMVVHNQMKLFVLFDCHHLVC